jgi:hypothetical protein
MRLVLIGEAAEDALFNEEWLSWISESFGVAVTVSGFALFVLFYGALGLYNWTESFKVPAIWLVLMTPTVAAVLPVPVVWRLVGLVTVALALLFVGLWTYWNRM